jgi:hypothetical protein
LTTTTTVTAGTNNATDVVASPPNTSDINYNPGAGTGGYTTSTLILSGGNGEVVISWSN